MKSTENRLDAKEKYIFQQEFRGSSVSSQEIERTGRHTNGHKLYCEMTCHYPCNPKFPKGACLAFSGNIIG